MLDSLSNKAILTKARAMYGKRLTTDDYNEMMRMQSVSDITAYLKNETWYSDVLAPISAATAHRGQVESLIRRSVIERYMRLLHYDFSRGNSFYSYWIFHSEILLILSCMRLLNAHSSDEFIITLPAYLIRFASFDLMELAKVRCYEDLLAALSHTEYDEIVKKFEPKEGEKIDLLCCESALMTYYYQKVFGLIEKDYKGDTRAQLKSLFGAEIDVHNVGLIFRLKHFYEYQPEQIRKLLIGVPGKMTGRLLRELIEAPTAKAFTTVLKKTPFGRFFPGGTFSHIESVTDKARLDTNSKLLRFAVDAPVALAAYINCMNLEIENIFCIIEGIRYQVPMGEIKRLLV